MQRALRNSEGRFGGGGGDGREGGIRQSPCSDKENEPGGLNNSSGGSNPRPEVIVLTNKNVLRCIKT